MHSAKLVLAAAALVAAAPAVSFGQVDVLPSIQRGSIAVYLNPIATGLAAPLYGISAPGDASRMYVLEQKGQVLVFLNGVLQGTPALNIQARVSPPMVITNPNDERGLLGLAFHPGFNNPSSPGFRTLYTYNSELIPAGTSPTYVAPNGATQGFKNVVNEWKMTNDPNVIDPASRREIISFGKNANNHNGGTIAFGPDGYLYIGLGDGGNANDVGASHIEPGGNAQNLSTPLGKMLRIDPISPALTTGSPDPASANGQYRLPVTNPFQGPGQVPEAYAYGFRNPYRFAFDRLNGELIMADVGQNTVEEINRVTIGGNYGWAVKEADFLFNRITGPNGNAGTVGVRSPGSPAGMIDPIVGTLGTLEYDHGDGISITGGFVYRGTAIPELYGKYIFGDLALRAAPVRVDGRLFYADLTTGIINEFLLPQFAAGILPSGLTVHGFGQDDAGELYALTTNTPSSGAGGIVYKLSSCAISLQGGPLSASTCPTGTGTFSTNATGAGSLAFQWQWQPAGPATPWVNLVDGNNADIGGTQVINATGAGASTLVARPLAGYINFAPRAFRCVVTNACGSSTSDAATLTVCRGDFNCDTAVDGDDVISFFFAWDAGDIAGDVNNDQGVDGDDVIDFFSAWDTGC
ncbi:MAG: PQQ-dependent sugar dehydrogenase [Phycisphaerales bacterium]